MSYIQDMRALIGTRPLMLPVAAVLIENQTGQILLQQRQDNGLWGLNGGALEIGESAEEAARREVFEETGLRLGTLEWFALFSGPQMQHRYPNGDQVSLVAAIYRCREYRGELQPAPDEVQALRFFEPQALPPDLNPPARPVLRHYLEILRS